MEDFSERLSWERWAEAHELPFVAAVGRTFSDEFFPSPKFLYTLTVDHKLYCSTDLTEIIGFSSFMGVLGCTEVGPDVGVNVPLQRIR